MSENQSQLDQRKQLILRAVVLEYVSSADPVGSELITHKYSLGVRSATIRNELAEIAEMGFLEKPHASAGRIPSDQGYRYYVDHFLIERDPSPKTRSQLSEGTPDDEALQVMMSESTRMLSRITQLLSAATITANANPKVKHAVVTALGPGSGLLVVVLSNGTVENRLIEIPPDADFEILGHVNSALGQFVANCDLGKAGHVKNPTGLSPVGDAIWGIAMASIRQISKDLSKGKVILHGEEYLLGQPEFQRDASLGESLRGALEEAGDLIGLIESGGDPVQGATIGKEHQNQNLRSFTILRRKVYVGQNEAGTLAIVGPTRMNYDESISVLDYTAKAVSETLSKLFGN